MLARVTYALVGLALATLIGGFFTPDSNVLLFISIGLSVLAIVLVLVGAARRAREAPAAQLDEELFADVDVDEEVDEALAAIGDEDDEDLEDEEDFEELLDLDEEDEDTFADEEEEEPEPAPRRAPAKAKSKSKTKAKPKAKAKSKTKPKSKPKSKPKAKSKKKTASRSPRVVVVPGRDRYHSSGCRFVKGKSGDEIERVTAATAKRRGFEPCSVCSPD